MTAFNSCNIGTEVRSLSILCFNLKTYSGSSAQTAGMWSLKWRGKRLEKSPTIAVSAFFQVGSTVIGSLPLRLDLIGYSTED